MKKADLMRSPFKCRKFGVFKERPDVTGRETTGTDPWVEYGNIQARQEVRLMGRP
jgi:hypothetical protein